MHTAKCDPSSSSVRPFKKFFFYFSAPQATQPPPLMDVDVDVVWTIGRSEKKVAIVNNFRYFLNEITLVSSEQFTELKSDLSLGAKLGNWLTLLNTIFI